MRVLETSGTFAVVVALFTSVHLAAFQPPVISGPTPGRDTIRTAHELIRTFFPEMAGQGYRFLIYWTDPFDRILTTDQFLNEFGFNVLESNSDSVKGGGIVKGTGSELLNVYCTFRHSGQIDDIAFHGRAVHQLENEAFREEVNQHPEWTDATVIEVLKHRGAQCGPDAREAMQAQLPPTYDLQEILGGRVKTLSVECENRVEDSTRRALLQWRVKIETTSMGQQLERVVFVLYFEPFGGKLQQIVREQ